MIKIWVLLMLMSMPNQPSVKYNAFVYPSEEECLAVKKEYNATYHNRPQSYKNSVVTEAFCVPFDSFPIIGLNQSGA